jgi:hypothetical protein
MKKLTLMMVLLIALLAACSRGTGETDPAGAVGQAPGEAPGQVPEQVPAPDPDPGQGQAPASGAARAPRIVQELTGPNSVPSLPQWDPSGASRILYETLDASGTSAGLPTVADLDSSGAKPKVVGNLGSFVAPRWAPDGQHVVIAGARPEPDGSQSTTLCLVPLDGGAPVDLLPGPQARRGVSGTKFIEQWMDPQTLAFAEHMGTGVQELLLVDTAASRLVTGPEQLLATFFHFAPDSRKVAGQIEGGPAQFWVWDFVAGQFRKPSSPLPGQFQWFESWAGNETLLFSAWAQYPYADEPRTADLYAWETSSGSVTRIAKNAMLTTATEQYLVFIRMVPSPTLVVAGREGKTVWEEDLGPVPGGRLSWEFMPRISDRYVLYRHSNGEWRLSTLAAKDPVVVYRMPGATVGLSPDERHLAVLQHDIPARLLILTNPFEPD